MLGLYVSDHPLNGFEYVLSSITDTSIADLVNLPWSKRRQSNRG